MKVRSVDENFNELKKIIEKKLKEIVSANDDISRIAIVYDLGQYQIFPPVLAVLHHEDIEEFESLDDFYESLWNPAEFPDYATPELALGKEEAACATIEQLNEEYKKFPAMERDAVIMYIECAINAIIFSRSIKKDIVVFCTDPELTELKRNVMKINSYVGNIEMKFPSCVE